ncbi:MAG: YbhB/YbcL family Raf kinase inhibitor-like protein [Candidatus Levybacteria bacterium]|nr:YbhB/YbcL family Raf kinase inhibitor-like protein [Candidatus Levybacteria bacterium]
MKIKSPAFEEGSLIPPIYTCDGDNINPPLEFVDVPTNAQSLALIVEDPDAPGSTFTHWLVWNISPLTREISENTSPEEVIQGLNGAGQAGYLGACPPSGVHHYHFKLYALNKKLNVTPNISREELEEEIEESVIERAQLVGIYSRQ